MYIFEGYILLVTAKAIMFQSYYWEGPIWLPMSQISIFEDGDTTYVIKVRAWLCEKNDVPEFTYLDEEAIEKINDF